MNKVIIYVDSLGGTSVVVPAPEMFDSNSRTRKSLGIEFTNDIEVLEWIIAKDVPAGVEYFITTVDKLPKDRYFRNAWTLHARGNSLTIKMDKAKEIHKEHLRSLRKPLLDKLDIEYMRALEQDDKVTASSITHKKQALRDVTKTELPANLEDLKSFVPEILQGN